MEPGFSLFSYQIPESVTASTRKRILGPYTGSWPRGTITISYLSQAKFENSEVLGRLDLRAKYRAPGLGHTCLELRGIRLSLEGGTY